MDAASANYCNTAVAEIAYTDYRGEKPTHRFYTWRCADGDVLSTDRGDENGSFRTATEDGPQWPQRPTNYLIDEGQNWEYSPGSAVVRTTGPRQSNHLATRDLRASGLNPVVPSWPLEAILSQPERVEPPTFEQEELQDGTWHVTVNWNLSNGQINRWNYWIDPNRNWNIIRSFSTTDGIGGDRTNVIDYMLVDCQWFPREVLRLSSDGTVTSRLEVIHAQVNRPEHVQDFSPADMGLETGVFVMPSFPGAPGGVWDDNALLAPGEYTRRVELGLLEAGPGVRREWERLRAQSAPPSSAPAAEHTPAAARIGGRPRFESEWEEYTRDFIRRYRLTPDQSQRALTILRDCQARAWDFLRRHRAEFEAAERARSTSPTSAPAARLKDLLAPIDAIFEEELKPRLNKLPTREQHAAVANDAASSPADKP